MSMEGERLVVTETVVVEDEHMQKSHWGGFGVLVLWFIIIAVLIYLILYSLRPQWVLIDGEPTQVDSGRLLLAALIIAFIVVLIIWLVRTAGMSTTTEVVEVDTYSV